MHAIELKKRVSLFMDQVAVPQATSLIKSAIKSPIIVALDNMDDRQALKRRIS